MLKNSTDPEERLSLQRMIDEANAASHRYGNEVVQSTTEFLRCRLNYELDNKDLRSKLTTIMMSIDGCDYIDFDEAERVSIVLHGKAK